MRLAPDKLRDLAASVGFPDPAMAAAVAMCESFGDTDALNVCPGHPGCGALPERSVGLWQVNTLDERGAVRRTDEAQLYDPVYNARAAYVLSNGGTSWGAWVTTIQSGCYRQYLPAGYVAPVLPPAPAHPPFPYPIRPPQRRGDGTVIAVVAGLSLAAAAGYAEFRGREFV